MKTPKLFVGGLAYSTDEDRLTNLFTPYGQVVTAKIIRDRYSGDSKGFGFVEMATVDEATEAMNELNGAHVDGRNIAVNEAKERPQGGERSDRGGDRGGHRGGDRGGDRGGFRGGNRPPRDY